jgi:hypothetical protein
MLFLLTVFAVFQLSAGAQIGQVGTKCMVCGLAINEIEGMLIEKQNDQVIEAFLKNKVCPKLR